MNIKKLVNELVGTAVLLIAVVGSSYMAASLTSDKALSLLIVAAVTAAALAIIIKSGAAISGAHYNPAVTISSLLTGGMKVIEAIAYMVTQIIGAIFGVLIANAMFSETLIGSSSIVRSGNGQFIGEVVATTGLVYLALTANEKSVWKMIPLWIFAAYFFTASTSFANPAATISRIFTDAPTGITGESVIAFISAQIVGVLLSVLALKSKVLK
jgi:glycerol uptake facilitator-like aquaporin